MFILQKNNKMCCIRQQKVKNNTSFLMLLDVHNFIIYSIFAYTYEKKLELFKLMYGVVERISNKRVSLVFFNICLF